MAGSEEIQTTEKLIGVTSVTIIWDTKGSLAAAKGSMLVKIKKRATRDAAHFTIGLVQMRTTVQVRMLVHLKEVFAHEGMIVVDEVNMIQSMARENQQERDVSFA